MLDYIRFRLLVLLAMVWSCSSGADPATSHATGGTSGSSAGAGTSGGSSGGRAGGGAGGGAGNGSGGASGASSGRGGASGSGGGGEAGQGEPVDPVPALPCFIDAGQPAGSAIDLVVTPSRTAGVAPLSVFFETVGTTADATMKPFHELAYCWDFDDPMSGSFPTTGRAKNQARGPGVAHVFEQAGTYTVTVSARDAMGRVQSQEVTITVDDPDTVYAGSATSCLSVTGDFEGCPSGATQITGASLTALANNVATGQRLLLHRGEEFGGYLRINVPGPGTVGAYGSGSAKPRVLAMTDTFFFSDQEPNCSDWRVMDVDVAGMSDSSSVVYVGGKMTNLLLLRVNGTATGSGVGAPDSIIDYWNANGSPGHDVIDGLTIADCELRNVVGGGGHNLAYVAAHRFALLGDVLDNSDNGEHVLRTPWVDRGFISNSEFGEAPAPRHLVKMHAPKFDGGGIGAGKYTEQVVISDNVFKSVGSHDWSVAIGPQNDGSNEHVRDILVERNLWLPGPEAQVALIVWGQSITVRDNLFNRGPQATCMAFGTRGIEPSPTDISVLGNTCYSESDGATMAGFDSTVTNAQAYNNLLVGPMVSGSGIGSGVMNQAGNLGENSSILTTSPPMTPADFQPKAGSAPVDAGYSMRMTPWDFDGRARPADGDGSGSAEPDVGAIELAP